MTIQRIQGMAMALVFIALIDSAFGKPFIQISEREYDAGRVREGAQTSIWHSFPFKNTGDGTLTINNVRKSCGCTSVDYDTTLAPNQTGAITCSVDLTGYSGTIEKHITIESNAKNEPSLRLVMKAEIEPVILVSKTFVLLPHKVCDTLQIQLKTNKDDLHIPDVVFKPENRKTAFDTSHLAISHALLKSEGNSTDGKYSYNLVMIIRTNMDESVFGDFILTTNHPLKTEIKIKGVIRVEKE